MLHEVLVDLFREGPELLVELLGDRLEPLLHARLRFERDEPNLSQLAQIDADLVLRVYGAGPRPSCALVVEVQLGIDPAKPRAWPAYQAGTHRRLGCPSYVVVVAIDPSVAAWAGGPFCTGQTVFRPIVLGPAQVPIVDGSSSARASVELILLSGLAHRHEPEVLSIGDALWHALDGCNAEDGHRYWDLFLHAVGDATRRTLMMRFHDYEPQSEWGKRHFAEGKALGLAQGETQGRREEAAAALLDLLDARGILLAPEHRSRIEACADPRQLRAWLRRAATATCVDAVFEDGPAHGAE